MTRIGLISDTHGLLRPEAVDVLRGCDRIVHAGDVGRPEVLGAFAQLAPLTAVRGNNDQGAWAEALPETALLSVEQILLCVVHEIAQFRAQPDVRVVVSGHSHKPAVAERDGLLLVNPGSAGPRRFRLPITVGELVVSGSAVSARIIELVPR